MERLIEISAKKVASVDTGFKRYLFSKLNIDDDRLIIIKGARGTGKTTLLLQFMKHYNFAAFEAIYLSMDDIYFSDNKLIDLVDIFMKYGGKYLFLDDIHRYNN